MNPEVFKLAELLQWVSDPRECPERAVVLLFDEQPQVRIANDPTVIEHPASYLEEREEVWREEKRTYGDSLWNGAVSTIQGVCVTGKSVSIRTGQCEYKDIVFKKRVGPCAVRRRFGLTSFPVHAFTAALPVTEDGRVILGVVGGGTISPEGAIDLIGGTLNLDEHAIASFDDIQEFTARELRQETGLRVAASDCAPVSLNFHNGCCFWLFRVPIRNTDISACFRRNKELDGFHCTQWHEISEMRDRLTGDAALVLSYASRIEQLEPVRIHARGER
jgi:hypothetical protein